MGRMLNLLMQRNPWRERRNQSTTWWVMKDSKTCLWKRYCRSVLPLALSFS